MRYALTLLLLFTCARVVRAEPAQKPTVAVLYFDYSGPNAELVPLRKGLASMLISDLASSAEYRIVERDRLEDVFAELKLQSSAQIDPATAARAGRLLGAQYLVLGSFFSLLKQFRVDARVVDVETGKVVYSSGGNGRDDDFMTIEQQLAVELRRQLARLPRFVPRREPTPNKLPSPPEPQLVARPRPPKQLSVQAASDYGRALSSIDAKNYAAAKGQLQKVVATTPDFELASYDLKRLMKQ